jgi:hypothetical protein
MGLRGNDVTRGRDRLEGLREVVKFTIDGLDRVEMLNLKAARDHQSTLSIQKTSVKSSRLHQSRLLGTGAEGRKKQAKDQQNAR